MKTVMKLTCVMLFLGVCSGCNSHGEKESDGEPKDSLTVGVKQEVMHVDTIDNLIVYTPTFNSVDLVCANMPSPTDSSVIMMCEAAFTGQQLKNFDHKNIAGNHVSGSELYIGYSCKANTGCFAWYADSKTWEFAMGDYKHLLSGAEEHGGMAFGQSMIIYNYIVQDKFPMKNVNNRNEYRVLAEYNNQLCIIDGKGVMPFKDFVQALDNIKVKYALYLDMGSGWNFSWFRDNTGKVHCIHKEKTKYATNWIVFRS